MNSASPLVASLFDERGAGADQLALAMGTVRVTYGALKRDAVEIADWLRRAGVEEGDRVALVLPKSVAAVEVVLGILAMGAVYVPLNPKLPPLALKQILRDLGPRLAIADDPLARALLRDADVPGLRVAVLGPGPALGLTIVGAAEGGAPSESSPDLAAILYTSGSTGEPKGIMLSHTNIKSFVDWAADTFALSSADRVANHAPLHFDLSTFDIFATLSRHGTVHLIGETTAQFPGAIRTLIDSMRLTVWYSVPTALVRLEERHALKGVSSLRLILFAGEVFPMPALRRLMEELPAPEYVNLYGPTETNVCTYYRLPGRPASDAEALPIGRPCEHLEVSLCDAEGVPVAQGETGEICVTGPSVMSGYWCRPDLTRVSRLGTRAKSYRTGDYGYLRGDGLLMLTGRRDQQAKLRGHRIELLALEAALNTHPGLREAAALVVPDERTGGRLLIYAVAREEALPLSEIRNFVGAKLAPSYQPDGIEWLQEMPRTANGKTDRASLRMMAERSR